MDKQVDILKKLVKRRKWVKHSMTIQDLADTSKVWYSTIDDIVHGRRKLSKQIYNKIYKWLDTIVTNYSELLQEFGMQD